MLYGILLYQSNLYGIEINQEQQSHNRNSVYQSNLYGIEIEKNNNTEGDHFVPIEPLWN